MAGASHQSAQFSGTQVAVSSASVAIGGSVQGYVSLNVNNQGASDCFVWAVTDGSTPSASDVINNGALLAAGGNYSSNGTAQTDGSGGVIPRFWAVCASGSTTLAVSERR